MNDATAILALAIWLAEALSLVYMAYRGGFGLLGLKAPKHIAPGPGDTRFLILVPAKDEAEVIGDTVACLQSLDYAQDMVSIYVVADNCSDRTEGIARLAGANVLVKRTPSFGKGSTIQWALAQSVVVESAWDAVIIFDADSRPQSDFLRMIEGSLREGDRAIQGRTESHGQRGWVPTAYAMNTSQRNRVWHQSREAAGFSAALTGTGMCLTREILHRFPLVTHTLTEDLEYGALLTKNGVRCRYLYDAVTIVDQPPSLAASVGQRLRWARGQLLTAFAYMPSLLTRAVTKAEMSSFDTALYLLLPSIVPFQFFLVVGQVLHYVVPGIWPRGSAAGLFDIPLPVVIAVVAVGLLLPFLSLRIEHRRYVLRDWAAFGLLMATWIAIAVFAAMTTWVTTWHRTPRGEIPTTQPNAVKEKDGSPIRVWSNDKNAQKLPD